MSWTGIPEKHRKAVVEAVKEWLESHKLGYRPCRKVVEFKEMLLEELKF